VRETAVAAALSCLFNGCTAVRAKANGTITGEIPARYMLCLNAYWLSLTGASVLRFESRKADSGTEGVEGLRSRSRTDGAAAL
jgi:hypothetical protein